MSRLTRFPFGLLLAWMSASCGTPAAVQPTATTTPVPQATATNQQVAEEAVGTAATRESAPFLLLEPGPYYAGKRKYAFEDASAAAAALAASSVQFTYPAWARALAQAELPDEANVEAAISNGKSRNLGS